MDEAALKDLARSGISEADADLAGIYDVEDAREECYPEFRSGPAIVFPYQNPFTGELLTFERKGQLLDFARVRYMRAPLGAKKFRRYDQPLRSGVQPYFPVAARCPWAQILANGEAICITEGEKKALAACINGCATIGLGGVYNFMDGGKFLPLLEQIEWRGRVVYIIFDSDAATNPDVRVATERLAAELSMNRGADVRLVRLPEGAKGADGKAAKVGLDDFIVAHGVEALYELIEAALPMRRIDGAVLALNHRVAFIEADDLVYDLGAGGFLKKAAFVNGSDFSTETVVQTAGNGNKVSTVQVAAEWLVHPMARRYRDVTFRPDIQDASVPRPGGFALNLWKGWRPEVGDVTPFLELYAHVCSQLPEEHKDLFMKLLAYKVQHPAEKFALAPMLMGPTGSGKSMLCDIVRQMAGVHGKQFLDDVLKSDFNGWAEDAIFVAINEVKHETINAVWPRLKALIADKGMLLNEKFRVARTVDNCTFFMMTTNDVDAAAFDRDDRRIFVIPGPGPREPEFYQGIADWMAKGGPAKLLGYLLTYDLKDWKPPARAPMTTAKNLARMEDLSAIGQLAELMHTGDENTILMWIDTAMEWARGFETGANPFLAARARETAMILPSLQIRPWYSPNELAHMFPMLASDLLGSRKLASTPAGQISKELRQNGIRYLECKDDPMGFKVKGRYQTYLVVADMDDWKDPITQNDFDRLMKEWNTYAVVRGLHRPARTA